MENMDCSNWQQVEIASFASGDCEALCEENNRCKDYNVGRAGSQFAGRCSLFSSGCARSYDNEWDLYVGEVRVPAPTEMPDDLKVVFLGDGDTQRSSSFSVYEAAAAWGPDFCGLQRRF